MEYVEEKDQVKKYYDQEAKDYKMMYQEGYQKYPANLIRLNMVTNRLKQTNIKTILDVGCGTCAPMIRFLKEGFKVKGFDFSEEMVAHGKSELENAGYDPNLISQGDLDHEETIPDEKFDAVIALGVFPHIDDEKNALTVMGKRLDKGGQVFIEFRNDLFAAFTLNKYSLDFFLNRVLDIDSYPDDVAKEVIDFYQDRLKVDKVITKEDGKLDYTDVLAKFRNPLSIEEELFRPCGFKIDNFHFYHFHAFPPIFENKFPEVFKDLSLKMEKPNSWRGFLMASAYVVEATKL